jgi:hypothetical protein
MDALELLKQDHQKVKRLFEQCQAAKGKKQQKQIFRDQDRTRNTYPARGDEFLYSDRRIRRVEGHGARIFGGAQAG